MATVTLKDLVKEYPGNPKVRAVKSINLEIRDKEFMVFVGPSGCGKSTTLRMIAGLEVITDGVIQIGDRVVNNLMPKDRDIAMVFQNYALYPHMTLFDNISFGLKLRKVPKEEIKRKVHDAAKILGIEDMLQRKPKALSGGQRQRVAVGRAIVRDPAVFLFDEPLSNLDAKMRVQMRTEITKLHTRLNATMIYVTHDQVEAMTMGDRICVMKDGEIMQVDEPLNLYKRPANVFVGGFIGSPPMNFFRGRIIQAENKLWFEEENPIHTPFRIALDERLAKAAETRIGKPVILGVRPEDVRDSMHLNRVEAGQTLTARVDVAEPMGAETFLYLDTGQNSFIAKVPSDIHYKMNEELTLQFDYAKTHLFDADSELRLSS